MGFGKGKKPLVVGFDDKTKKAIELIAKSKNVSQALVVRCLVDFALNCNSHWNYSDETKKLLERDSLFK